jgi:hypothetical protein
MEPFSIIGSTMLKSVASAGAGKLVVATTVEQGTRKWFPSDVEKAIQAGLAAAQAEDAAALKQGAWRMLDIGQSKVRILGGKARCEG